MKETECQIMTREGWMEKVEDLDSVGFTWAEIVSVAPVEIACGANSKQQLRGISVDLFGLILCHIES